MQEEQRGIKLPQHAGRFLCPCRLYKLQPFLKIHFNLGIFGSEPQQQNKNISVTLRVHDTVL